MKGPFTQVWAGFRESNSWTVTNRGLEGDLGNPDRKESRGDGSAELTTSERGTHPAQGHPEE